MKTARYLTLFFTMFFAYSTQAEDIQIIGRVQQPIEVPRSNALYLAKPKSITLLKLALSEKAQQALDARIDKIIDIENPTISGNSKVQLGMNEVPVLDQGAHGTCVTFSVTAALDALLNKGDYISQVCQLTLGTHLENNGYTSSGWDGSWARNVLSQMELFGIVNKITQKNTGCAGFNEYPLTGQDPTVEFTLPEFHQISEKLPKNAIHWVPLIEPYQFVKEDINEERILTDVKNALNAGDRVVFGVLLFDFNQGVAGAIGKHNATNDTWVLTPELIADLKNQPEFAGHAMIITGYDDKAKTVDAKGRSYTGLLTLRNSWGAMIGDQGNFYMTYDYFKLLVLEAQRIKK